MRIQEIIRKKRDGHALAPEELEFVIQGYTAGDIPDYQVAALLMAIFFKGMNESELSVWTHSMLYSGEVLEFPKIPGLKIDKHSTGGVGDKISIALAPLVAACGVKVPMVSGRGLGHTGGTLDKLEAIDGFNVLLDNEAFEKGIEQFGYCLIGQTSNLAPADKKLYALRDVTGTVESIPLIASSIMSKKLAEGIDGLVLDVKVGRGAFMKTLEQARELAEVLVGIGKGAVKKTTAFITRMEDPLGLEVGNGNEIKEAIDILEGCGPEDTTELTLTLGAEMIQLAELASSEEQARKMMAEDIQNGKALQSFIDIVEYQNGDVDLIKNKARLLESQYHADFPASEKGTITGINAEAIGLAAMELGAGRRVATDSVDPRAGLTMHVKTGDSVTVGQSLLQLHYNDPNRLNAALSWLNKAFEFGDTAPPIQPLILDVIR